MSSPLERADEELRAADALLEAGFPSQALSRAYLAAFHAAQATLLDVGEVTAVHAGVVSAYARRSTARGAGDQALARSLRKLFEDRQDVDYGLADAPSREARLAIQAARSITEAAAGRLDRRARSA